MSLMYQVGARMQVLKAMLEAHNVHRSFNHYDAIKVAKLHAAKTVVR